MINARAMHDVFAAVIVVIISLHGCIDAKLKLMARNDENMLLVLKCISTFTRLLFICLFMQTIYIFLKSQFEGQTFYHYFIIILILILLRQQQ